MNYSCTHPKIKFHIVIILALFTLMFGIFPCAKIKAKAVDVDKITYAYLAADTILYRADTASYTPIVTLPQTYFVALLTSDAEDYLNVSYLDITGFVLKSSLEICDYEPVTKYATLKALPNNDGLGVNLRDMPDHTNGKILQTIPSDATLTLYGSIYGTPLIPAVGDTWHYVKYTVGAASTFGYVYSGHVSADIPSNNVIEKVPTEPIAPPVEVIPSPAKFTTPMQIVFIIALSIPAIIIMLLIFKRKPAKPPRTPRHYDPK